MKRVSLYSSSRPQAGKEVRIPKKSELKSRFSWKESLRNHRLSLLAAGPGLIALALVLLQWGYTATPQNLTQEEIDVAVTRALDTVPLPSPATRAYEAVRGSIVRVRSFVDDPKTGEEIVASTAS